MAVLTSVYVLSVFLCFLALCGLSKGKQCYGCADIQNEGSTSRVNKILDGWQNPNCRKPLTEANLEDKDIDAINCGIPARNKVYKCGHIQGRLEGFYRRDSVTANVFSRNCLEVDKNLKDGCQKHNTSHDVEPHLEGIVSYDIADFEGELCVCSGNMCNTSGNSASSSIPNVSSFWKISMPLLVGLFCAVPGTV